MAIIWRAFWVWILFILYSFRFTWALTLYLFHREHERLQQSLGKLLVGLFRKLGATFIKFAQVLSTRADLVPQILRNELSRLHDQVGAFSYTQVKAYFQSELNASPDELFEQFDPYPIASASIAQVHVARYRTKKVAIKVLRPNVENLVDADLSVLKFWAKFLHHFKRLKALNIPALVGELSLALSAQLDLRAEAHNNRRFNDNFAAIEGIDFPQLIPALCTRRILVMSYEEGLNVNELDDSATQEIIARRGYQMMLHMVFNHGFVHADLHPGNMLVQGNRLMIVDLGLIATLQASDQHALRRLCIAWGKKDKKEIATQLLVVGLKSNESQLLEKQKTLVNQAVDKLVSDYGDVQLAHIQIGSILLDGLKLIHALELEINPAFSMVALSLAVVEGVARQLAPELDLIQEALPFLTSLEQIQ